MTNKIKIHVLHTGLVKVDKALPLHEDYRNPLAYTGLFRSQKNQILLPVSSYLIEHPKGLILVDTGWNELVRKSQWAELGLQVQINKAYLPAGWSVREQLERLGFQDTDIKYLLLSHLHSDHASGLPLVKNAQNILVSEEEWQAAQRDKLRYIAKMWRGVDVQTFKFSDTQLGPAHKSFDLFGDGSVQMILTPGHSRGLSATLVTGSDGRSVLLASDTGYAQKSIRQRMTPGIAVDRKWASMSVSWVNQMSHRQDVIETIVNHDPDMAPKVIELPYE
ncbi:N-acyl homoserine lactonase family protein [Fructobacillus ficulneus]|uniref:Metallo-beta-lactamase domain protein n=1 Tax=Fructobacillus ficulneus TaxID=157463 RepID=A0A0K8MHI6_9LACO|nr:N-acyl homoserine lactonase family protein [Fructobacillus ficulneus]GAO99643.1 metallo-beta-lactamase domain protein [Fructobacillus ficulneus]